MENQHNTYNRKEQNTDNTISAPKAARKRKPDPIYDAIAEVFGITAGGWVGNVKSMMLGTAKKGEWARCNFTPPVTDAAEILGFRPYMQQRMADKKMDAPPSACVTIQRWFYDYRAMLIKATEAPRPSTIDLSQWTSQPSFTYADERD